MFFTLPFSPTPSLALNRFSMNHLMLDIHLGRVIYLGGVPGIGVGAMFPGISQTGMTLSGLCESILVENLSAAKTGAEAPHILLPHIPILAIPVGLHLQISLFNDEGKSTSVMGSDTVFFEGSMASKAGVGTYITCHAPINIPFTSSPMSPMNTTVLIGGITSFDLGVLVGNLLGSLMGTLFDGGLVFDGGLGKKLTKWLGKKFAWLGKRFVRILRKVAKKIGKKTLKKLKQLLRHKLVKKIAAEVKDYAVETSLSVIRGLPSVVGKAAVDAYTHPLDQKKNHTEAIKHVANATLDHILGTAVDGAIDKVLDKGVSSLGKGSEKVLERLKLRKPKDRQLSSYSSENVEKYIKRSTKSHVTRQKKKGQEPDPDYAFKRAASWAPGAVTHKVATVGYENAVKAPLRKEIKGFLGLE